MLKTFMNLPSRRRVEGKVAAVEMNNLRFGYTPETSVIEDLSLTVASGQAHALLGASGTGKTTLLNLLSGLLEPTKGTIMFDGVDITKLSAHERNVTQVFQFPVLYEALTVEENLLFALRNRNELDRQARDRVAQIVDELSLGEVLQAKPRVLDLYQKQLVCVAKSIVRAQTSVVLLDEPLTAVDPGRKWQLRQVLSRMQRELNLTMIYVTHDQTEALSFADRVSVLTEEGVAQTGTPQEIYEAPLTPFVGHFVGSPGMNFVAGHQFGYPEAVIGFRPEWATLTELGAQNAQLQGQVGERCFLGTKDRIDQGLTFVATEHGELAIEGPLRQGPVLGVSVSRFVRYENEKLVEVVNVPTT